MNPYLLILIIFIALLIYLIYANKRIGITSYEIAGPEDLKIVQLSDIHNSQFGKDNVNLIEKVKAIQPDVIVVTGDWIDKRWPKPERCYQLAEALLKIAPVYYIRGNHEAKLNDQVFENKIRMLGVRELINERVTVGKQISLIGLQDVDVVDAHDLSKQEAYLKKNLDQLAEDRGYTILLSHQPQHFHTYCQYPLDLVLCGHAHGGQVRLPGTDGLFAPDQGILPKYASGMHQQNHTRMIVSRGLGNSLFPLRVFNDPEIIVINLKKSTD